MSREIKFRAWYRNTQRMYINPELSLEDIKHSDQLNYIIMQYTGHQDKNGTDIYEGDIVKGESEYGKSTDVVQYETSFAGYAIGNTRMSAFRLGLCKVIGNIYENPELLG